MGTENTISKGENIKIQVGDKVRIVKKLGGLYRLLQINNRVDWRCT